MLKKFLNILIFIVLSSFVISCGSSESEKEMTNDEENTNKLTVPVEAYIVKKKSIDHNVTLTGILQPIHSVDIISETSGKVKEIVKELGEEVTDKDTLAFVDDRVPYSQYLQAKARVLSTKNNLSIAKLNLESDEDLYKTGDISKLQLENSKLAVKTAEAELMSSKASFKSLEKAFLDTRIVSPIKGNISRKFIEKGQMVSMGERLYRVVNNNTLKVIVGVPQDIIKNVEVGNDVNIFVSALNMSVPGKVKFISPQADENTGSFNVEIHLENTTQHRIKAGMTAKINIIVETIDEELSVPEYAVVTKRDDDYVYKIEAGIAKLVDIEVKEIFGNNVIVENGISIGDTVVVVGMKNLGKKTKVLIESIIEQ